MNCKNCKRELLDDSDYCNKCGARIIRNRLTFGNLISHFSEEFLSYDNKLLQTFIALFAKPEAVIRSYITGTRKKYVNVISYFAIAITLTGAQLFLLQNFFPEALVFSPISQTSQPGTEALNKGIFDFALEYQSIILMLNVPVYALISKLVFFREKKFDYNYTEHLVIFMYILAQMSIVIIFISLFAAAFGISIDTLSIISGPLQLIYTGYALKRIFNLDWPNLILRTLIFLGITIVLSVIVIVISGLIAYNTGMLDEIIKAAEQARDSVQ
jgi:hypothetical protein